MDVNQLWKIVFDDLQVTVSRASINSWIKPLTLKSVAEVGEERAIVEIGCPSTFHITIIEQRYYGQIKDALDRTLGKVTELRFVVSTTNQAQKNTSLGPLFGSDPQDKMVISEILRRVGLREEFTFESFAVSSTNEMAHAATRAVSEHFGQAYNPLFLYGGVGVGKTHLMQAAARVVLEQNPKMPMIYCMGEQFTNEIIEAIQQKNTREFKKRYRQVRGLLIDDIQFIAGKNTVQEEFFHTFNAILNNGGQVILTSDRPPSEIAELEARLRSRFEAGLIVDISEPDFELRAAITMIKAKQKGLRVGVEEARLIAGNIESARKIEGFLIRLITEAQLRHKDPDIIMIQSLLGKESRPTEGTVPPLRPNELIRGVARYFELPTKEITGNRRTSRLVLPRHAAMYLLRVDYNLPLTDIGSLFSGRDHTSVMHAVDKITMELKNSTNMRSTMGNLRNNLYSNYGA